MGPSKIKDQDEATAIRAAVVQYVRPRIGDAALVEDIVQEAMARLAGVVRQQAVETPRAMAVRIAERLVIDHYRAKNRTRIEELNESLRSFDPSPEETAIAREQILRLQEAIRTMPPLRRDVFLRRRVHGHSCTRIAADLKLTPRAVEAHVARALKDLADLIEETRGG
ncbi:MAG: RNA polymerase sigma factor [Hyphomonadaceae bacterium]